MEQGVAARRLLVELGEPLAVLATRDDGLTRRHTPGLEPSEPSRRVGQPVALAQFTVIDDVDADLGLLLDDIRDCRRQANLSGTGRLPTWVVRMRSVLSFRTGSLPPASRQASTRRCAPPRRVRRNPA